MNDVGRHRSTMAVAILFGAGKYGTSQLRRFEQLQVTAQLLTYRCGAANGRFGPNLLKKCEHRLDPIVLAPVGAVFRRGRGGPHHPRLAQRR